MHTDDDEYLPPPDTDIPATAAQLSAWLRRISRPAPEPEPLNFDPDDYPIN